MWEDDAIANDVITAIINNFNDEDEDVRAASVQALCELAKHSKKAHAILILLRRAQVNWTIETFLKNNVMIKAITDKLKDTGNHGKAASTQAVINLVEQGKAVYSVVLSTDWPNNSWNSG